MSSPHICNVKPLLDLSHKLFIDKETSSDDLRIAADILMKSTAKVASGRGTVSIDGTDFVFTPSSVFGVQTMDSVLVTDYSLMMRSLLMTLLAPAIGQRYNKDPLAIADFWRHASLRFFSGASLGGAIYDSGRWRISPHWIPIASPNPLVVSYSTIEDPVARTLNAYVKTEAQQRDTQVAAKVAVDPFFVMLAMGGTTVVSVQTYPYVDMKTVEKWQPTLTQVSSTADDVLQRAGTFVPDDTGAADWNSSAFEQLEQSGYIIASLQVPRVFSTPSILNRLVKDDAVEGRWWFRSKAKDFAISGIDEATLVFMKANATQLKYSFLDDLRGYRMRPALVTAINASPLAYVNGKVVFKQGFNASFGDYLELTEARRAWIRSDPSWPASSRWIADTSCRVMSRAWFDTVSDTAYAQLRAI